MVGLKRQVVLLLTHEINDNVESSYRAITKGLGSLGDAKYLLHDEERNVERGDRTYCFSYDDLESLGYKMLRSTLVPGSNHFPLFLFARDQPDYDYYWIIEYDVRFNGCWSKLFTDYADKQYDFCSCHIREYEHEPDWYWWELQHPNIEIPMIKRLRSFNTIYRISSKALKHISLCLSDGWKGHHEVLMPTLLHNAGFKINDFGGKGSFVERASEEKYYISSESNRKGRLIDGSMRYRPCISEFNYGEDKLYHPCK